MPKSLVLILLLPYLAWTFQYLSATVHSQDVPSAPTRELWHPHIYTAQKADDSRVELRHGAQFYETTLSFMQMSDEEESEVKSCRCRFVKEESSSSSGFLQTAKGKQSSEILIQAKQATQTMPNAKADTVLLQGTATVPQRQTTYLQEPAFVQQGAQQAPQAQPVLLQEPAYHSQQAQQPVFIQEPYYAQPQPVMLQEQQPHYVQQYAQQPVYLQEPSPYGATPTYLQQPHPQYQSSPQLVQQYQTSPQLLQQPQYATQPQVLVQYPNYNSNYYQSERTMEPQPYVLIQEVPRERVEYIEVPRQEFMEVPGYMRVQPMYVEASRY